MKSIKHIALVLFSIFINVSYGQGNFINLNFESPILPLVEDPFGMVPASSAIPGWQPYIGSEPVDKVLLNTRNIDEASISLYSADEWPSHALNGIYSVYLKHSSWAAPSAEAAIAQYGTVPAAAMSISMAVKYQGVRILFDGNEIPLYHRSSTENYDVMIGDISGFAGQYGELRLTGTDIIDNIRFSTVVVPEPSIMGLSLPGIVLLCLLRRHFSGKQRRNERATT